MIIRRGELVDLLAKALLYAQVDAHYKQVGILSTDIPCGEGLRAWAKSSLVPVSDDLNWNQIRFFPFFPFIMNPPSFSLGTDYPWRLGSWHLQCPIQTP